MDIGFPRKFHVRSREVGWLRLSSLVSMRFPAPTASLTQRPPSPSSLMLCQCIKASNPKSNCLIPKLFLSLHFLILFMLVIVFNHSHLYLLPTRCPHIHMFVFLNVLNLFLKMFQFIISPEFQWLAPCCSDLVPCYVSCRVL